MRTFEVSGISTFAPVKVLIMDDELELPDNLSELTVFFFHIEKDSSGTRPVYREDDSLVCFAKEEDIHRKVPNSSGFWSAKLRFLVLECHREMVTQLVVR